MSIFAQAGQMEPDKSVAGLTMTKLQEELQQNCQKLNQAAAQLTKMTRAPDEELGKMSGTLAQVIGGVADAAKKTASKIADSVAQQEVLSSAKSLSIASHQLVLATKDVQRLPDDNTAQQTMTASLTAINECVNNLLTTVTRSSAESARSEKELEGSKQQIMALLKNVKPVISSAEQVVEGAREVLAASAEVVFASNQGEVIQAGKASYLAVEKLLQRAAGASRLARNDQDAQAINQRAAQVAQTVCQLLETGKLNRQDEATQPKLEQSSGTVANAIQELGLALKKLPGTENLQIEDTKNDLDKVAEEELRKCAEIISAAAQTLSSYKPPPREKKIPGVLDQMDINEAIVNAAQAIASATGTLVTNAYDAQRERVADKIKAGGRGRYAHDPTWANGLISASHSVAGSVQALVKSANQAAQGKAEEESLVASARSVASATAHLVSASKAKSDPNSKAQQALGNAAKSVATATSQLVTAAGQAAQFTDVQEEEDVSKFNFGSAGGKAKELEQQTLILKLEKELERERKRMLNMRKAKYQQT